LAFGVWQEGTSSFADRRMIDGGRMNKEAYRFAFDEANAELIAIMGEFEQLRIRKERVEKVVEALKPLAAGDGQPGTGEKNPSESPSYSY
jgi:hypothetical protein